MLRAPSFSLARRTAEGAAIALSALASARQALTEVGVAGARCCRPVCCRVDWVCPAMAALQIIVSASRSGPCVSSRPRHRARSSRRRVQPGAWSAPCDSPPPHPYAPRANGGVSSMMGLASRPLADRTCRPIRWTYCAKRTRSSGSSSASSTRAVRTCT
eukprot:scaffold6130_cov112-Isochrysis_galbana.AAC.6